MSVRRTAALSLIVSMVLTGFLLGHWHGRHGLTDGVSEAAVSSSGAAATHSVVPVATGGDGHRLLVERIKQELRVEMGLLPVSLLRQRRDSFVELHAYDNSGELSYATAGYLGGGHFITVKHGVMALGSHGGEADRGRRVASITVRHHGRDIPAEVVDSGNADVEVHPGDWAIIRVREVVDLPALVPDFDYAFDFAAPIFRMGNDYSKGIIPSTGYVGQRMSNGLVTCLTDGHPGVSGGGVLNQDGRLVGIPIGRMEGDYRFSFILPVREEMFRKVPVVGREGH